MGIFSDEYKSKPHNITDVLYINNKTNQLNKFF